MLRDPSRHVATLTGSSPVKSWPPSTRSAGLSDTASVARGEWAPAYGRIRGCGGETMRTYSEEDVAPIQEFGSVLLVMAVVLAGVSLWCTLFGPRHGIFAGVLAFMMMWGVGFFGQESALGRACFQSPEHVVAGRIPALYPFKKVIRTGSVVCLTIAVVAFPVLMISSCDGVADFPVFEHREVYTLNNHGNETQVSRLRYVAAGAAFATAWHFFVAGAALDLLGDTLFGKKDSPLG